MSWSPVHLVGTADRPVTITAEPGAGGIAVIDAGAASVWEHAVIDGLSAPRSERWGLPGGVNFYRSDLRMHACRLRGARAEDALNIVRSRFELLRTRVSDAAGDCLDLDFSTGTISASSATRCGNDALDVSGGHLRVDGSAWTDAGDKALSAGEGARVVLEATALGSSAFGVATKDGSVVAMRGGRIAGCRIGAAAYVKKDAFGPAKLRMTDVRMADNALVHLLESGSSISLDGRNLPPNGKAPSGPARQ